MHKQVPLAVLLLSLGSGGAQGAVVTYTDSDLFFDALADLGLAADLHGFDAETPGAVFSGDTRDGIGFEYALDPGRAIAVNDTDVLATPRPTRSERNEIGTDDPATANAFVDGEGFTMTFGATQAFGLFVHTSGLIFRGDFTLAFAGTSLDNSSIVDEELGINTDLYFLGIIDDSTAHGTATLSSADFGGSVLRYTVDDIITADAGSAPAPATLGLLSLGLAGLARARRRS